MLRFKKLGKDPYWLICLAANILMRFWVYKSQVKSRLKQIWYIKGLFWPGRIRNCTSPFWMVNFDVLKAWTSRSWTFHSMGKKDILNLIVIHSKMKTQIPNHYILVKIGQYKIPFLACVCRISYTSIFDFKTSHFRMWWNKYQNTKEVTKDDIKNRLKYTMYSELFRGWISQIETFQIIKYYFVFKKLQVTDDFNHSYKVWKTVKIHRLLHCFATEPVC